MKKRIEYPKTPKNKAYLADFRRHVQILGYVINGQEAMTNHVGEFLAWLESKDFSELTELKPVHINQYHAYIRMRPHAVYGGLLSLKSIATHMRSVRLFFTYLQERGDIVVHPMSTLRFPPPPKRSGAQRVILTQDEIKQLYEHCEWLHERAILSLAYGCGLRNGEITLTNVPDVKLNEGILIVPRGKGNKRRVIPMSAGVRDDLKNYYENERSQYVKQANEKAFMLNIKGDRLQHYTSRKILRTIVERTGNKTIIEKNIAIHNLRHSIATHLIERGVHVEQVRNFLGHAHVETTEIYTRVSQAQLKKLIQ